MNIIKNILLGSECSCEPTTDGRPAKKPCSQNTCHFQGITEGAFSSLYHKKRKIKGKVRTEIKTTNSMSCLNHNINRLNEKFVSFLISVLVSMFIFIWKQNVHSWVSDDSVSLCLFLLVNPKSDNHDCSRRHIL